MKDNFQIAFNIIMIIVILSIMLIISFRSKLAKSKNPEKEQAALAGETIGVGILIAFLIFAVFAVGYWGS